MSKIDSSEENKPQNNKSKSNVEKIDILKSIGGVTKSMIKNPSMIIKSPINIVKNFDSTTFKIHAKKHPVKTAAVIAVGAVAFGAATAVAVLAAPAAIAVGGVGALVVGAAAVTAGSVALTVASAKLTVDTENTMNNLSVEEKRDYNTKVTIASDKKVNAMHDKVTKAKEAREAKEARKTNKSTAEKIDQVNKQAKNIATEFHIESNIQNNSANQKASATMHLIPSGSPTKRENSTKKSVNSVGGRF